jgi:hypothetical protein
VDYNGVKEVIGLPSSIDVVPPTFFGKLSGISIGVSNSFPFPASDSSICGTPVSYEGISSSFIFLLYLHYPVHLFQSLGEALPALKEGL